MKELFGWVVLIFVNLVQIMAQDLGLKRENRFTQMRNQKPIFSLIEGIEQRALADGSFYFITDQFSSVYYPVFPSKSNRSIKSLTTVSFFAPVCKVRRKAFVKVIGEGLKVGNRTLGKSTYGALALSIQF